MEQLQILQEPVLDETVLLRSLIDRAINIRQKQREILDTLKAQLGKPKRSARISSLTLTTS